MCNTLLDPQQVQHLSPPQHVQTGTRAQNPSIRWAMWNNSPGREVDHTPQSSTNVKNGWSHISTALLVRTGTSLSSPFVPICFPQEFILKKNSMNIFRALRN